MKLPSALPVSDAPLWDIWMSTYPLAAVTVADEINLFTILSLRPLTTKKLAEKLLVDKRAIAALADILVGLEFLQKDGHHYSLTETSSTYLLSTSVFYWGPILKGLRKLPTHQRILDAIKSDSTLLKFGEKTFTEMWEEGNISAEAAENFTQSMQATGLAPALTAVKSKLFKGTKRLLDIGGGSGCFSIAFVNEYANCQATIFELPVVCEFTQHYLQAFSATKTVSLHPGNFFKDPWPSGYDGIFFSQIFHDWPITHCKKLTALAYEALPRGGKIFIHEMLLNEDKNTPLTTACFNLLMYLNHRSQQFTQHELFNLLTEAGFNNPKVEKTSTYYSLICATK